MVSNTLLFWYAWLLYRFVKLDLVTVEKIVLHFSGVLDYINANASTRVAGKHASRGAQNVCVVTRYGFVLTIWHSKA